MNELTDEIDNFFDNKEIETLTEEKEIFNIAFSNENHETEDKDSKILKNTIQFLKSKVMVIDQNLSHECYSIKPIVLNSGQEQQKQKQKQNQNHSKIMQVDLCYPKCALDFPMTKRDCLEMGVNVKLYRCSKLSKLKCFQLNINPDIYYCEKGLFHNCSQICPGSYSNSFKDNICFMSGKSKSRLFISFCPQQCPDVNETNSASNRERNIKKKINQDKVKRRINGKDEEESPQSSRNYSRSSSFYTETTSSNFRKVYQNKYFKLKQCSKQTDDELNKEERRNAILSKKSSTSFIEKKHIYQPLNVDIKNQKGNRLRLSTKKLIDIKGIKKFDVMDPIKVIKIFTLQIPIHINNSVSKSKEKYIE